MYSKGQQVAAQCPSQTGSIQANWSHFPGEYPPIFQETHLRVTWALNRNSAEALGSTGTVESMEKTVGNSDIAHVIRLISVVAGLH